MSQNTSHGRLRGLLSSQFLGAFNDNAWKMIVTLLALNALTASGIEGEALERAAQERTTLAFVVFTLPLVLFSFPAAYLADRISKTHLAIAMKGLEFLLMVAATVALFAFPSGGWPCLVVLGFMGAQSALFSPAKYGLLPELVKAEELPKANGSLELSTFLAIVLGTGAGGLLLSLFAGFPAGAALVLALLAILGFLAARKIPYLSPAAGKDAQDSVKRGFRALKNDKLLLAATCASAAFWMLLSLLGQDVLVYSKSVLALDDASASVAPALFGLGVGLGAFFAGKACHGKIELALVPLGATSLATLLLVFGFTAPGLLGSSVLALLIGVASGFVIVPLDSLIQAQAPAAARGAVIALSNVVVFAGMLLGSLSASLFAAMGLDVLQILVLAGLMTYLTIAILVFVLPAASLRCLVRGILHIVYRSQWIGVDNVPKNGAALICPNHVSFLDWAFVAVISNRPLRFVVEKQYYDKPLWRPFMRAFGAIPIATDAGPRVLIEALRRVGEALDASEVVCLFPEGEISRGGGLLPFRRGVEKICKDRNHPLIPIHISGMETSRFSLAPKPPKIFSPRSVRIRVGKALEAPVDIHHLRRSVEELGYLNTLAAKEELPPLHAAIQASARRRPFALAWTDQSGRKISWLMAVASSLCLARRLREELSEAQNVAVLLPASPAAALANASLSLLGRPIINLNFSAGKVAMSSACQQGQVRDILTSRRILSALDCDLPVDCHIHFIEDLMAEISIRQKLGAACAGFLLPRQLLEKFAGAVDPVQGQDVASILFSSGSTGEPKGIVLSHAALAANCAGAAQLIGVNKKDRLLGILPPFHAFGTMMLWYAAAQGLATVFHSNPLDGAGIGALTQRFEATILLATPSFLELYHRRCTPGQLASLRLVLAGAEKLRKNTARAFEDKFGIRPLEGYGATELSPVVALSAPGHRSVGLHQPGQKHESVGKALPGVLIRIVNPDSGQDLQAGKEGLVLIKSPSLMTGYLGRPDLSEQVIDQGWYKSGDLGRLDGDGFLTITDRLARFSKIGGEMVPHGRIENKLQEAVDSLERVFAVTGLPDKLKGERLAVLHTAAPELIPQLVGKLRSMGLPNLFIPHREAFFHVEKLPLLGSGKLDLKRVKEMALDLSQGS